MRRPDGRAALQCIDVLEELVEEHRVERLDSLGAGIPVGAFRIARDPRRKLTFPVLLRRRRLGQRALLRDLLLLAARPAASLAAPSSVRRQLSG